MRDERLTFISAVLGALGLLLIGSYAQAGPSSEEMPKATGPSLEVLRADTLIDMPVKNQEGEELGRVGDLMIDTADGHIAFVVLDTGLFGELLAIPWPVLSLVAEQRAVLLYMDHEKLQSAPTFKREQWPETVDPHWLASVYNYYGFPPYPGLMEITVDRPRITRATTLKGLPVRNPQRDALGNIESLMIDIKEGHIAYFVLGVGGILRIGERPHVVPWKPLQIRPVERVVVLNVPEERLLPAPPIDQDLWLDHVSYEWLVHLYSHYGARPYWQERG